MSQSKEEKMSALLEIVKPYTQDFDALSKITEETQFIRDLKINSANLVDIILDIEDKFDIEIDNDSMDKMMNVGSALEVIEAKLAAK
jgi:acyl carrier protein